jgi:hypothetical protein
MNKSDFFIPFEREYHRLKRRKERQLNNMETEYTHHQANGFSLHKSAAK